MKKIKTIAVDRDEVGEFIFDTDPLIGNEIPVEYFTSQGKYFRQLNIEYPDVIFTFYSKENLTDLDISKLKNAWAEFCPR